MSSIILMLVTMIVWSFAYGLFFMIVVGDNNITSFMFYTLCGALLAPALFLRGR